MNFVENNGKKVAAILCVASAFPDLGARRQRRRREAASGAARDA